MPVNYDNSSNGGVDNNKEVLINSLQGNGDKYLVKMAVINLGITLSIAGVMPLLEEGYKAAFDCVTSNQMNKQYVAHQSALKNKE